MLQFRVWSQLARIKSYWNFEVIRHIMEVNFQPPIKVTLNQMSDTLSYLDKDDKHFFANGERGFAVAVKLLQDSKIIALPTDTIYGLAGLAQNPKSVEKLYELKGRDKSKPFAICLSSVSDISSWGEIDRVPYNLILSLLPGPVTIVVQRKPRLNPSFNPGLDTVGIRVTKYRFVRSLSKILNQPLALTSANSSNDPSSLEPKEFSHLWPQLGGIFHTTPNRKMLRDSYRVGSTIVDLVIPNTYKIIRRGIKVDQTVRLLEKYGLKERES
ncbi:hypothetical protein PV327_002046 [Microctonus hyperodae]|uniref:Threonylcarbamoyl-AMP synthase n=1 Tax=Microctonus hyperodae TaxID=165561 RepID=A0AA39KNX1_MICHY|nr:hypothetical protein PV327_002046 [Microctonus hyperodae]